MKAAKLVTHRGVSKVLHGSISAALLSLLLCLSGCLRPADKPVVAAPVVGPADTQPTGLDAAFDFIRQEQDRFHNQFTVCDDRDSGNEHFFPSGWMGDIVGLTGALARLIIDGNFSSAPFAGTTCIKFTYPTSLEGGGWGGIYWEYPENNPLGSGYDLSRYKAPGEKLVLKFWARGQSGGEFAEFAFRHVIKGNQLEVLSRKEILTTNWTEYQIDLGKCLLTNVTGGFALVTRRPEGHVPTVIYVDNVRIELGAKGRTRRLNEPHFVRSYVPEKAGKPDMYFRSACYSYDNALIVLAFCARGSQDDLRRAGLICDAFVEVQNHDLIGDGRVRNGYACGDIIDASRGNIPRLPGWWDDSVARWFQESYCAGTDSGNMAWVAIALLEYWEKTGRHIKSPYLGAAKRISEWLYTNTYASDDLGGYRGGIDLVEKTLEFPNGQRTNSWKSCEHNIDIFVAFERLSRAMGNATWRDRAQHARQFVWRMVDITDQQLWTGTELDGITINRRVKPVDVNPWSLMAFEDSGTFGPSVEAAAKNSLVSTNLEDGVAQGFDFDDDKDGIWWEGTAQMQLAFRLLGQKERAGNCLQWIRRSAVSKTQKGAIMTATRDGLTTGFKRMDDSEWVYWRRPHAGGATCWYIFAELGWNPYWGKPID